MTRMVDSREKELRKRARQLLRRADRLTEDVSAFAAQWAPGYDDDQEKQDRLIDAWGFLQETTGLIDSVLND